MGKKISAPPAKEFVAIPDALLHDTEALHPFLERSYRYAQMLKPKRGLRQSS